MRPSPGTLSGFWPAIPRGCAGSALLLAMAAGCSGLIGGSAIPGSGAGGGGGAFAGVGGRGGALGTAGVTGAAGMTPIGTAACPSTGITPSPLRRLTRFEYANTVRYLLGVDSSPANDLPADEITDGFDNNSGVLTVSSLHAEKYVLVSETLAKAAVANLSALTTCDTSAKGEDACALEFARSFGRRAFRRPTTSTDEQLLMAAYSAGRTGGSYAEGIEVMIGAALQSVHFLYRLELTPPADTAAQLVPLGPYEMATRLSYLIWSAGPDDALLDAAAGGKLATRAGVAAQARTMLQDPKARPAIVNFYNEWVGTYRLDSLTRSSTLFPSYSTAMRDAMAQELPAFVQYVLWTGDHRLDTLLRSPVAFVTAPLAPIYGVAAPAGSSTTPQMVTPPDSQGRSGILTQAGFLAVQAHPDQTSPVLRGKFVRSKLMCQPPSPPPPDVNVTPPDVMAGGTARQRFSAHLTAGTSCNGCHVLMDPIGLAFENFDALGQYRTTEAGQTIDASGNIIAANDPNLNGTFNGVRELATKLAASDQVRDCVATQWFRFAAGRGEGDADACSLGTLQEAFAASGGDLTELVVATTQTDAFWYRAPITP